MIGLPFNPNNCLFIANQALNANQFNGNVPDTSNRSNHTVLWDFIDNKIYWVNTFNNIIEREIDGGGSGLQNESYEIFSQNPSGFNSAFLATKIAQVLGNNYLLLPAGTYVFDLEFDIYPRPEEIPSEPSTLDAFIFTNINQAETGINPVTDVLQGTRRIVPSFVGKAPYPLDIKKPIRIINQTVTSGPATFTNPFIVKSAFLSGSADLDLAINAINNIQLRALLVK